MRLLTIILILLSTAAFAEEAAQPELSRGAQRAVTKFEKAKAKADNAYRKEIEEAHDDLVDDLEKEMDKLTRAADLDGALAVKALIEESKDLREAQFLADLGMTANPSKKPVSLSEILCANTWTQNGFTYTFAADGSFTVSGGWTPYKWMLNEGTLTLVWNGGRDVSAFEYNAETKMFAGKGGGMRLK